MNNEPEIMTIKLDCKVLDPDKLIVVTIDQSMKREIPNIQHILKDSFPTIKFLIANDSIKLEEIEDYLSSRSIQYKEFKDEFDIEYSALLREDLAERLRKY